MLKRPVALLPGGAELYDQMLDYLNFAEEALATAADPADLRSPLIERFPDHGGVEVLDHQLRFLFRQPLTGK